MGNAILLLGAGIVCIAVFVVSDGIVQSIMYRRTQ